MRALLINPERKSVREIEHDGKDDSIRLTLGCRNYQLGAVLSGGDQLYFDADRVMDNLPPVACFYLDADNEPPNAMVVGPGLVVGHDGNAKISITELISRILFVWCRYWPTMGIGIYSDKADALRL